jgi:glycosyltransferase involved in cell wall biosynthesis
MAGSSTAGNSEPRLSVIVPARNAALHIARCLDAIQRNRGAHFELLVVDDGSADATAQIAERYGARCLATPSAMGPGGARNVGARHARGEILVFVDADVVLPEGALELIEGEFEHDPELAAVFGSYDSAPAWGGFLSQYKNLMHHYVHQKSKETAVTFWAGCGAIRKAIFEEFGGFNAAKYPKPSIEDIELGLRMTSAGRKIRLNPRIQVKHLKRWTLRVLLRADILYRAVPWTNLILETRNLPRDLNLTFAARLSAVLVGLLTAGLALLPVGLRSPIPWIFTGLLLALVWLAASLLALNWDVYTFFRRERGWWFAAGAVLAHWFYYLYSGAVFLILSCTHFVRALLLAPRSATPGRQAQG